MTTRESKKSSGGKTTSRNTKSSFDVIELGQAEKKFAIPKNEMDAANKGGYTLTKPHRKKLRLSQNFKTQECERIFASLPELKISKEILNNKKNFYQREFDKFQEQIPFRRYEIFDQMTEGQTIITIEYYFEENSKSQKELNEQRSQYEENANEIVDHIKGRFPFIDVITREIPIEEIDDYYEYGLFEIQIAAKCGTRTGVLYSKKISKILPHYQKIIDEIYFFVDKSEIKIQIYDILKDASIVTPKGLANKTDYAHHLENVEVIIKQHLEKNHNETVTSLNFDSSKANLTTQDRDKTSSMLNSKDFTKTKSDQSKIEPPPKQNIVKLFTTKVKTNKEGKVTVKDLIIENDFYLIEIPETDFFQKHTELISLKQMLLDEINLYIALRPKNIHQVSINLKDSLSVVSRAGIKISNTKMMEEMDDENRDVAIEKMNSWCFDILESNNIPGNYAFLAEAGIYYLKFHKPGYKIEYQMIKVQKDCSFDFNMTISKSVKLSFMLIDVLNFSIIPDVDISVYDQGGHLMDSGASNGLGQFESKTELGALIKVLCKNTGYVTLYQEYLVTTTAILDKIYIGMIPMSEEASSLDVLAVYPKDTFTVSLHAICPENYIVNYENPICEPFDAKYQLYSYGNYLVEKIEIRQDLEVQEKPHWDFEFLMSNKAFNGTDADKITKRDDPGRLSNSPEQNTSQSLKSISPLSARMSSINGIKSANRPSTSRSNSSMLASSPLSQRGSRAFTEELTTHVDINNCLRVYVVYKNVLQEVLYCTSKFVKNQVWKIGIFKTSEELFKIINSPDMKHSHNNKYSSPLKEIMESPSTTRKSIQYKQSDSPLNNITGALEGLNKSKYIFINSIETKNTQNSKDLKENTMREIKMPLKN